MLVQSCAPGFGVQGWSFFVCSTLQCDKRAGHVVQGARKEYEGKYKVQNEDNEEEKKCTAIFQIYVEKTALPASSTHGEKIRTFDLN